MNISSLLSLCSLAHIRASISSFVEEGSCTLNHGGVLPLLQQVPSQSSPSQSGSLDSKEDGMIRSGLPDSQYQLFPTNDGGDLPGLLEQGQFELMKELSSSAIPETNVQRCCRGEPCVMLNQSPRNPSMSLLDRDGRNPLVLPY